MTERPKNGADPDATIMVPAGGAKHAPDPDATVMVPAKRTSDDGKAKTPEADADATVMFRPAKPVAEEDATVMFRPAKPVADEDATVMFRPAAPAAEADATVMFKPAKAAADEDATVMFRPSAPAVAEDATVLFRPAPAAPADDATILFKPKPAADDATVMVPAPAVDEDATVMMGARAADIDPDATIAIPTPGRRRAAGAAPAPVATGAKPRAELDELGGLNPLVAAANPVLAVVAQIRQALRHPDPEGLRKQLRLRVDEFETRARAGGATDDAVNAASIALCALVDESAASTPWGESWASKGLLAERHRDGEAGEVFFKLLELRLADAAANRDVLEFFYVCLALGFEGKYRQVADGRQALSDLRAKLLAQLRAHRPARDGELSAHWRGVAAPARAPAGVLGVWVAGAVTALLLAALYIGLSFALGGRSDPVARDLAQLKAMPEPDQPKPAANQAPSPRIAESLAAEISRGEVAVTDAAGMSTIVIRSDRLFASGSARLDPAVEAAVMHIAEALERTPGSIVVTGHTDDVPIRTARFPSNWELSTERAASVLKLMAAKIQQPGRLRAEGLADSAPLVANDSAANRARNRRVEIILRSVP